MGKSAGEATTEGPIGSAMKALGVPVYKLTDYDAVDRYLTEKGIPYNAEDGANLSLLGRVTRYIAAAIREDRAEPVSEAEVMAALAVVSREARIAMGRDFMRAALQAARQARATADANG